MIGCILHLAIASNRRIEGREGEREREREGGGEGQELVGSIRSSTALNRSGEWSRYSCSVALPVLTFNNCPAVHREP